MSSLFGSLSIAVRSLLSQQAALETTSNNIANVNTPGFSRQRAVLNQEPPIRLGTLWFGNGVGVERIESIRDRILELRLNSETEQQGRLEAYLGALKQVEAYFNETEGAGLEGTLSGFFNALSELSTNPSDLPLRQRVIIAGENLARAFQEAARNLHSLQQNLDQDVAASVDAINSLGRQIADLNANISAIEGTGQEAGSFVDQRNLLIRKLSELVDVSVIPADNSLTVTTANGTALVVGSQSLSLETQIDPGTGLRQVLAQGDDITATIESGRLGGLLAARDRAIPSVNASLDRLAADLANSFNVAHHAGFDLSGTPGGDFFVPPPAGGNGAAAVFAVAIGDPSQFAASSDGSPGSNGNLLALTALREQSIVNGQRPSDFYANLLAQLGNDVATASVDQAVGSLILQQLTIQRGAVSGVSLDEEAANLIRFQQAFQAAARVVSVVNELTQTAVNLGRN